MIIVAGHLLVDPSQRAAYLESSRGVIEQARQAPGCIDFHLAADPLEDGRINIFEQWASMADVETFRGSGPSDDQAASIIDAAVYQHAVSNSTRL
jgi:quinol monooxygenase YgiN